MRGCPAPSPRRRPLRAPAGPPARSPAAPERTSTARAAALRRRAGEHPPPGMPAALEAAGPQRPVLTRRWSYPSPRRQRCGAPTTPNTPLSDLSPGAAVATGAPIQVAGDQSSHRARYCGGEGRSDRRGRSNASHAVRPRGNGRRAQISWGARSGQRTSARRSAHAPWPPRGVSAKRARAFVCPSGAVRGGWCLLVCGKRPVLPSPPRRSRSPLSV